MNLAEWLLIPLVFAAAAASTAALAPINPFMDSSLAGFIFGIFGVVAITLTLTVRSR